MVGEILLLFSEEKILVALGSKTNIQMSLKDFSVCVACVSCVRAALPLSPCFIFCTFHLFPCCLYNGFIWGQEVQGGEGREMVCSWNSHLDGQWCLRGPTPRGEGQKKKSRRHPRILPSRLCRAEVSFAILTPFTTTISHILPQLDMYYNSLLHTEQFAQGLYTQQWRISIRNLVAILWHKHNYWFWAGDNIYIYTYIYISSSSWLHCIPNSLPVVEKLQTSTLQKQKFLPKTFLSWMTDMKWHFISPSQFLTQTCLWEDLLTQNWFESVKNLKLEY